MTDDVLIVEERPHSLMGPSSFDRAETCPASTVPSDAKRRSSIYADEGTMMHALFEAALVTNRESYEWLGSPLLTPSGDTYGEITMEMVEIVDPMVDWVRDNFAPDFVTEPKLSLPDTPMYGYADVLGHAKEDGLLTVGDLKTGMTYVGEDSTQLGLYGLMAWLTGDYPDLATLDPDAPAVRTVILQPRLNNPVRSHVWTAQDLRGLHVRVLNLAEQVTGTYNLPYEAGPHCQWCNRAGTCPQLRLIIRDVAQAQISRDPDDPVDVAQLEKAAAILPAVKHWLAGVEELLSDYVMAGGQVKGMKIVRGNSRRDWADPDRAKAFLKENNVNPYTPGKLLSPAQAEKALPKLAKPEVKALVEVTPGKLKAVHESAPGNPVNSVTGLANAPLAAMASKLIDSA